MNYNVGIYIRLSKEDINKKDVSESESIINQRNLIQSYINKNNLKLIDEYVDDGYSGTTFDRPAFNRLINDIEDGKINMVITKDLSRLGRDYIQSGYYLEQYFPMKKVRYVSILDNIDTSLDSSNNDIAPFKALFNDMQSKDTSKKIRSILRNKKEQGLFLGSSASFGYLKDPYDKHKLMIDPNTSHIVRRIFDLSISGKSPKQICTLLNNDKIKTPIMHKNRKLSTRYKNPTSWTPSTIHNILSNFMYTGSMIQGKQAKLNYKSKNRIILDKNQWIIVKNTHEPIISIEEFELVNRLNSKIRVRKTRGKLLLEGLLYCEECGSTLGIRCDNRNKNNTHYLINCNTYLKNPGLQLCKSHFMIYEKLEEEVLKFIHKKINSIDKFKLNEFMYSKINDKKNKYVEKIRDLENKRNALIKSLKEIYIDKTKEILGFESYKELIIDIEKNLKEINDNLKIIKEKLNKNTIENNVINKIKLTRELLFLLIDKITISKEKVVKIHYKFSK